jgi:hypothetical protein
MRYLVKPFTNEKNQFIFCIFGFFWVSNIGRFVGSTFLLRILIYPVFLLLLIIFMRLLFQVKTKKQDINTITYNIFLCLLILSCICVARGIPSYLNIDILRTLLFDLTGSALVWLMPLSLLFALKKEFWLIWIPKIKLIVIIGCFYALIITLFNISHRSLLEFKMYNSSDFLFIAPFLIIWSRLKNNSTELIIGYIGVGLAIISMFLVNERFAIVYTGLICIFFVIAIFFGKYRTDVKINMFASGFVFILITTIVLSQVPFFQRYIDTYLIQGKILEDTRGGDSLSSAVINNMTISEFIFGKGNSGVYIWGHRGWPPQPYIRNNVEIGYMQLMLKGGYTLLTAFLALSLYAVYLGIFRSNNRITQYLACIIIARLIIMSTAMPPRIGFEYFMYWLVIGGCLSKAFRSQTDNAILSQCNSKKLIIKW